MSYPEQPDAAPAEQPAPPQWPAPEASQEPAYSIPAQPTYGQTQPTYPPAPPGPAYPPAAPAYTPGGYAYPAAPASAVPASSVPASAAPASAPGYGPYAPVTAMPYGQTAVYPGLGAPTKRKRSVLAIVFGILMVVFLLFGVGAFALSAQQTSKLNKASAANADSSKTVATQTGEISSLKAQLESATTTAATTKQTLIGQINELKHQQKLNMTCVNDVDKVSNDKTQSAFDKDFNAMLKACLVAKAES